MKLKSLLFFSLLVPALSYSNVVEVAGYRFVAPENWKQSEPSSSMRKAQFELKNEAGQTAELVFFYFGPSGGGGVRANVDRWMKQFKDIQSRDLEEKIVEEVKVTYARATGTFLSGSPFGPKTPKLDHTLFGAIAEGKMGSIFLKMIGRTKTVLAHEEAVETMIKGALKK